MGVAYQLDGSVICTGNGDPNRTATYAGPKNGTTQLSSVATFFAGDPPVVSAVTLDYVLANMPVPASSSPPGVADAGTVGNTPLVFAQSNHSHASKARKQRVTGVSTATYTWTFPTAFGAGVVPVCHATVEDPANVATDSYNVQVVGTPTNTTVTFRIIRTSVIATIFNLNATPGTVNLHLLALEP